MTEGVSVMKDKELKLEETEASHTIGGSGEGRDHVRGKWRGSDYLDDNLYTGAFLKRKEIYIYIVIFLEERICHVKIIWTLVRI